METAIALLNEFRGPVELALFMGSFCLAMVTGNMVSKL